MKTQDVLTTTKWGIDAAHSEVQFKVKHLVISTVTGFFRKFDGSVVSETEDFDGAKVKFSIDAASIDTNVADRDAHLKSPDFFAADQHPKLTFEGVLSKVGGTDYKLNGDLTIRGTSKPVELAVSYGGQTVDPWGNTRGGFELTGKINRKQYGLNWSATTEAGGLVVADDVKLNLNVEVVRQ